MIAGRSGKEGPEIVVQLSGARERRPVMLSDESIAFLHELLSDRIHQNKQQLTRVDELPASAAKQWCDLVRGEMLKGINALSELAGGKMS